jgi:hypothetical protein
MQTSKFNPLAVVSREHIGQVNARLKAQKGLAKSVSVDLETLPVRRAERMGPVTAKNPLFRAAELKPYELPGTAVKVDSAANFSPALQSDRLRRRG